MLIILITALLCFIIVRAGKSKSLSILLPAACNRGRPGLWVLQYHYEIQMETRGHSLTRRGPISSGMIIMSTITRFNNSDRLSILDTAIALTL